MIAVTQGFSLPTCPQPLQVVFFPTYLLVKHSTFSRIPRTPLPSQPCQPALALRHLLWSPLRRAPFRHQTAFCYLGPGDILGLLLLRQPRSLI
ncbi:hypothetical protein E2C01_100822 [Portunus trituberculatus]|uniref:Uncharacterized protein n=1 Tax=Portunus trituberculatus TaxID=210409 RepID=A0A5B7KEK6_PORTR|nr:hypothetical protein [Portunus trituberculatus]